MAKPTKLRKLRIGEIALVDRGANQEANIEILKRATDGATGAVMTVDIAKAKAEAMVALQDIFAKLKDPKDIKAIMDAIDAARNGTSTTTPAPAAPVGKADAPAAGGAPRTIDDVLASLSDADRALVMAALESSAKPKEPVEMACGDKPAVTKRENLPDDVRKALDEADQIRKAHAELLEKAETASFMKMASDLKCVPGVTTDRMATLLKSASRTLSKDDNTALLNVFKSAHAAIEKSALLVPQGAEGNGEQRSDNTEEDLVSKAHQLVKDGKASSFVEAHSIISKSDTYRAYAAERDQKGAK